MTVAINKRSGAGAFSFLKSKTEWMEISDYYVGDIISDKPVSVLTGATVVGNIFAPQVRVAGLLYGTAVSHYINIAADGLVWSNVYSIRLQIEDGGKIQGFVSSIDAATYDMLCAVSNPDDLPAISFGKNAPDGAPPPPTPDQLDALIRLQTEAGAALAARAELEHSFDTRLTEIVGKTRARATSLDKDVGTLREKLMDVSQQLGEAQALSQAQMAQIKRANSELSLTRELLREKTEEWEGLTAVYNQQSLDYEQLQAKKADVDVAFHAKTQEADDLTERVTNLETALQSSLQHSGEQEDSLIRWQELGETRQQRIEELEKEMEVTAFKLEESGRLISVLRAQRQQAEDSWEKSNKELQETAALLAALTVQHQLAEKKAEKAARQLATNRDEIEPLRQQLAQLEKEQQTAVSALRDSGELIQELHQKLQIQKDELKATKAALAETTAALEESAITLEKFNEKQTEQLSAQTAVIMAEANKTVDALKQRLAEAEQQQTIQDEQLSWHKLSLKTTRAELEQARQALGEQEETAVSQSINNERLTEQQQKIEQYELALADVEEQFETLQADLAAKQQEVDALKETKETLRRVRLQLKANEGEIERYLSEMKQQGQHLADIQSTLIEREIQLQQMNETARKQAAFIKRMKKVATERIQKLQQQLVEK